MPVPNNSYFGYLSGRQGTGTDEDLSGRLGAIEEKLGIAPTTALGSFFNQGEKEPTKKSGGIGAGLVPYLKNIGKTAVKDIRQSDSGIAKQAPEYAQFLAGQVSRGERSPLEASDLFADFALAYDVPGAFQTASELGRLQMGKAPKGSIERYRPFQAFAAQALGIGLSEEDVKLTEQTARALGKTSPEAFSQLLGQRMLSSPEYIRKTPLAFAANLPYGGKYGVGYQTPEGTFTGTYRFKPPTAVDYS